MMGNEGENEGKRKRVRGEITIDVRPIRGI